MNKKIDTVKVIVEMKDIEQSDAYAYVLEALINQDVSRLDGPCWSVYLNDEKEDK